MTTINFCINLASLFKFPFINVRRELELDFLRLHIMTGRQVADIGSIHRVFDKIRADLDIPDVVVAKHAKL